MGRKKKPQNAPPADEPQSAKGSSVIRVDGDLGRKLAIISTATGEDIRDIVSPLIRPEIERRYAEVVRQLGEEIKEE